MAIALIIIAAGASNRLGQPKQLLPYKDGLLLKHTIDVCRKSKLGDIHLILGAHSKKIVEAINFQNCKVFTNPNWEDGMGNSIAFGIRQILNKKYTGAIIIVGDQPFLNSRILKRLIRIQRTQQSGIIISKYKEGMGPPTFFSSEFFEELSNLKGDSGARAVIKKHKSFVHTAPFAKGWIDIDTKDDLKYLS